MTIYQQLLHIDEATFERLMASGLMRANARRDLLIYARYLADRPRHGSMQAMSNAARHFHLGEDQVKKIIYRLRANDPPTR